jgi:predicted nucleic acid-binding protein
MKWKKYAIINIEENTDIIKIALLLDSEGLQKMDSLHIACAIFSKADYFLTTDDKIIRKANAITEIKITDPIDFIKKAFPC